MEAALIGQRIRDAREARGLTQDRLAEIAGIHKMTLQNAEKGRFDAKVSTLAAIARALDTTLDGLVEPEEEDTHGH